MAKRNLKVWGMALWRGVATRGIVAATSQKEAAKGFRCSLYEFRLMASETGNVQDFEAAIAKPGVLLVTPDNYQKTRIWREDAKT